jgi:hypothetical protein
MTGLTRVAGCDSNLVAAFQNRVHNLNVGGSIIHQQHSLLLISLVYQSLQLCATSGDPIQFHQRCSPIFQSVKGDVGEYRELLIEFLGISLRRKPTEED